MMTQESALGRRRTLALGGHNVPVGPTPEVGSLYVSLRNSIGHHRVFASRLASSGNISEAANNTIARLTYHAQ
jgi:hypothetical protein